MTPIQQQCLDIVNRLNSVEYGNFFYPSEIMATIQVESTFRPHAYRREPSGVASYGLCQVLDVTAKRLGLTGSPEQMYDPKTSIRYGMKGHKEDWDILAADFKRDPIYEGWAGGYKDGVRNAFKGR